MPRASPGTLSFTVRSNALLDGVTESEHSANLRIRWLLRRFAAALYEHDQTQQLQRVPTAQGKPWPLGDVVVPAIHHGKAQRAELPERACGRVTRCGDDHCMAPRRTKLLGICYRDIDAV